MATCVQSQMCVQSQICVHCVQAHEHKTGGAALCVPQRWCSCAPASLWVHRHRCKPVTMRMVAQMHTYGREDTYVCRMGAGLDEWTQLPRLS